jgi:hypothetical protein
MPSCNLNDPRFLALLDHYQGRIEARVAEDAGGAFDIPLTVEGREIACLRLRADEPVMLYRNAADEAAALSPDGAMVPLP